MAYTIAFLALLLAPLVAHRLHGSDEASPKSHGDVETLVILTPHSQDIRNEFGWAFTDWYQRKYGQHVEIDYRANGGNNLKRQLEMEYAGLRDSNGKLPPEKQIQGKIDGDLIWGGGDTFFDHDLKPLGILRPIELDPQIMAGAFPEPTIAGGNLYDRQRDKKGNLLPPQWIGICLGSYGILCNPDLCDAMGIALPTTWNDLTRPEFSGSLALADPTQSTSSTECYLMVIQRAMADAESDFFNLPQNQGVDKAKLKALPEYQKSLDAGWTTGMRRMLLMAANARYFSDSSSQVPNDIGNGDAAAGVVIDYYGLTTAATVGPKRAKFVFPAASAITPDPISILYGTQHPELAQRFVEFLLSREGQRLWIVNVGEPDGPRVRPLHRAPIRRDVYADRSGWCDDINYFAQAGDFNQRPEWSTTIGEMRPIWAAEWIDTREDLRGAYQKVLAVPDSNRRQQLLDQLADIPITRADVAQQMAEHHRIDQDKTVDADMWRTTMRMNWARKFRDHYHEVGRLAM